MPRGGVMNYLLIVVYPLLILVGYGVAILGGVRASLLLLLYLMIAASFVFIEAFHKLLDIWNPILARVVAARGVLLVRHVEKGFNEHYHRGQSVQMVSSLPRYSAVLQWDGTILMVDKQGGSWYYY